MKMVLKVEVVIQTNGDLKEMVTGEGSLETQLFQLCSSTPSTTTLSTAFSPDVVSCHDTAESLLAPQE